MIHSEISLDEFKEIKGFIYENMDVKFLDIKPNVASQFIGGS